MTYTYTYTYMCAPKSTPKSRIQRQHHTVGQHHGPTHGIRAKALEATYVALIPKNSTLIHIAKSLPPFLAGHSTHNGTLAAQECSQIVDNRRSKYVYSG